MNNKIIELRNYFIKNHNYGIIQMENSNDCAWIYNADFKYNLIRISTNPIPNDSQSQELINKVINIIEQRINCEIKLLDIHIVKQQIEINTFYDTITIESNFYDGIDVLNYYPYIKEHFNTYITQEDNIKTTKNIKPAARYKKKNKNKHNTFSTYVVMGICIFMYLLYILLNNINIDMFSNHSVNALLIGSYYKESVVVCKEYYRLFTSGFIHLELWHLFINMYALKLLGEIIERNFGTYKFLSILFLSIIGGNLFCFYIDGNILAIGLSGGLYGLLASIIINTISSGLIKVPQIRNNLILVIAINIIVSVMPGVSFSSHLGGFITGSLVSIFIILEDKYKLIKINSLISVIILYSFLIINVINVKEVENPRPGVLFAYASTLNELGFENYAMKINIDVIKQYHVKKYVR